MTRGRDNPKEVLRRCEQLVGTEGAVRKGIRRGLTSLAAYEKFGAL